MALASATGDRVLQGEGSVVRRAHGPAVDASPNTGEPEAAASATRRDGVGARVAIGVDGLLRHPTGSSAIAPEARSRLDAPCATSRAGRELCSTRRDGVGARVAIRVDGLLRRS